MDKLVDYNRLRAKQQETLFQPVFSRREILGSTLWSLWEHEYQKNRERAEGTEDHSRCLSNEVEEDKLSMSSKEIQHTTFKGVWCLEFF